MLDSSAELEPLSPDPRCGWVVLVAGEDRESIAMQQVPHSLLQQWRLQVMRQLDHSGTEMKR